MDDIAISNFSVGTISTLSESQTNASIDSGFSNILKSNFQDTNAMLNKADDYMYDFTVLRNRELHEVMIAAEEANMALKFTMQVRNKVIEAYQEMLRMQV